MNVKSTIKSKKSLILLTLLLLHVVRVNRMDTNCQENSQLSWLADFIFAEMASPAPCFTMNTAIQLIKFDIRKIKSTLNVVELKFLQIISKKSFVIGDIKSGDRIWTMASKGSNPDDVAAFGESRNKSQFGWTTELKDSAWAVTIYSATDGWLMIAVVKTNNELDYFVI